jgi:hypothetical protein
MPRANETTAEPRLVTPDGRLDWPAIAVEIDERCASQAERTGWANRDFQAHQVEMLAGRQRWPFIEASAEAQKTPEEREAFAALGPVMFWDDADRLVAAQLRSAVLARAVTIFQEETIR